MQHPYRTHAQPAKRTRTVSPGEKVFILGVAPLLGLASYLLTTLVLR